MLRLMIITAGVVAGAACFMAGAEAEDWRVAVLVEKDMVAYGGMPALPANKIPRMLKAFGVSAARLSVDDIQALGELDPAKYPVLVMPYGNAFPKELLPVFQAYRKAGGAMVHNGVPFCQPASRESGSWKLLDGEHFLFHDAKGLGTGGYRGPAGGALVFLQHGFRPNPLGLQDDTLLANDFPPKQWLDVTTFPAEDEIIPLVGLLVAGETEPHPLAAAIRHRCEAFNGALDVWLGQTATLANEQDGFLSEQLVARATAWCLAERDLIAKEELKNLYGHLDALKRPAPMPSKLDRAYPPRPWGDTFVPRSKPPARVLDMVDARPLKPEVRTALACLQGLTSRGTPSIWLNMSDRDPQWLDWHKEAGYIDSYNTVADYAALFKKHADAYRGAVIPDAKLYRGGLLAANVAACEDLIIATPELAEELALPVVVDLRGRFDTYVSGMRWVWETYRDRMNHYLCDFIHPDRLANGAFAYDLQWRGIMFWIVGPVDAAEAGTDMGAETQLVAEIMAAMAPNTAVLGFPYAGHGVGPGEVNGVTMASRYAKPLVCTDSLANASVMSGVPLPELKQHRPAPPKLEKDKIYIALTMSDGDNQNTWMAFFKSFFEHPRKGEVPLAFGMGPPIVDLMPAVADWYFRNAPENTEFFADVSGVGYIQPENYGLAYADRAAVLRGFLEWTAQYMKKLDMGTYRTVGGGDGLLKEYAAGIPEAHAIMADMGAYHGRSGIENLTYTLDGMPVFRAVTSWAKGAEGVIEELRQNPGPQRPAFVNGFVHCWTFPNYDLVLKHFHEVKDDDMVFVTPSQLTALYLEAREKGWVK